MTQGRKAYGPTKKARRDFVHFMKKPKEREHEIDFKKSEQPVRKKGLEDKLKKPRYHDF